MKMLGQDLHTQQEFDSFLEKAFTPLVSKVDALEKQVDKFRNIVIICGASSALMAVALALIVLFK